MSSRVALASLVSFGCALAFGCASEPAAPRTENIQQTALGERVIDARLGLRIVVLGPLMIPASRPLSRTVAVDPSGSVNVTCVRFA